MHWFESRNTTSHEDLNLRGSFSFYKKGEGVRQKLGKKLKRERGEECHAPVIRRRSFSASVNFFFFEESAESTLLGSFSFFLLPPLVLGFLIMKLS